MLKNFVLETVNAPGTSTTINLAGAPTGRQAWLTAFSSSSVVYYTMTDGTIFEWGEGVVTSGAPNTLQRTTVRGNSSGTTARLNFTGATSVYCALPSEYMVYRTSSDGISQNTGIINASAWAGESGGTSTAYTGTVTPAPTAYVAGQVVRWRAHTACGYSPTYALGALSAKGLRHWYNGQLRQITQGMIVDGSVVEMVYDDDAALWIVTSRLAGETPWTVVAWSQNGSSVTTVDFALPSSGFNVFSLEIGNAVPAASAIPFIRVSLDGGSTYESGASAYLTAGAQILAAGLTATGGTAAYVPLGPTQLSSAGAFRGRVDFAYGTLKQIIFDTSGFTTSTLPFAARGSGYCSVAGTPTHVRLGFVGQDVSTHQIRLLGARYT